MSLLWCTKTYKDRTNEKLKCIFLYNWSVLAAWIHPITKEVLLFWHKLCFEALCVHNHSFIRWLHGLKNCKTLLQDHTFDTDIPQIVISLLWNVSPIVPYLTLTKETSIGLIFWSFFSPTWDTFRALLSVSAFAWDTEWTKRQKVTW